jgi:hypothetical protein
MGQASRNHGKGPYLKRSRLFRGICSMHNNERFYPTQILFALPTTFAPLRHHVDEDPEREMIRFSL